MIRNIVFDMGNVLIRWCPEVFIDRLGIPEEDRPALLQEVFTSVDWIQLDRGIVTWQEAAARMCRRLPERLHRAVRELTGNWWRGPLIPIEGTAELIRELKVLGYGIYLLSNASVDLPRFSTAFQAASASTDGLFPPTGNCSSLNRSSIRFSSGSML